MKRSGMRVLVIDLQFYWREYVAELLRQADYRAVTLANYGDVLQQSKDGATWDLVVLGCANVAQEERELVAYLIARQQPVIVLSTALSRQDMRNLFRQGVRDVTDKTYHKTEILSIVKQTLEQLIYHDRSWELVDNGAFL